MSSFHRQLIVAAALGLSATLGLAGCSSTTPPPGSSGEQQASTTPPSTRNSATPSAADTWPLTTDAPVKGSLAWTVTLSDEWRRLDGGGPSATVYRNGLCRLTFQDDASGPRITNDKDGTQLVIDGVRTLYGQVPQIGDVSFEPSEPRWFAVNGVSTEFATLEFSYTMEATQGEQHWTGLYAGRAFAATQRGLAVLAECQGNPLPQGDRAMLESVLDGLTATAG